MLSHGTKVRAALILVAGLVLGAALAIVLISHGTTPSRASAASIAHPASPSLAPAYGPPSLARYREASPHVSSSLSSYGVQGQVQGAPTTPPDELVPVSPTAFTAPVSAYRAYSVRRLRLMRGAIAKLQAALAAGDLGTAQGAWRAAYAYYLNLGAVYLEGPAADLNEAIDGIPGALPGGASSPEFSGLLRLEYGLWNDAPLASLQPWARKLDADAARLARVLPQVQIDPLDYATRAHEILEDAVRDQLSGTDAPWSGAGVLGTWAGVVATTEVINTLAPVLANRENVLQTVRTDMGSLRATLASIQRAHDGTVPTTSQLTQHQSEQLDASIGQALEGLAQVPGALETTTAPVPRQIPAADVKIDR